MEAMLKKGASWTQRLTPMPTLCLVPEVTILEPLQDMQLNEGQDAHFRCWLSRAASQEARWALGGVPLQANEMNDITVEQGTLRLLTLHKVGLWDLFHLDRDGSSSIQKDPPLGGRVREVMSPISGGWLDGPVLPVKMSWPGLSIFLPVSSGDP